MACRNLAFSALQHAPIHRRSKPNGAIEGPSKIILSSKMGGYSYFGRSPRPPFCPPRGAEATVKKNLSRNLDLFAKNGENGGSGQIPLILATTVKPALEKF